MTEIIELNFFICQFLHICFTYQGLKIVFLTIPYVDKQIIPHYLQKKIGIGGAGETEGVTGPSGVNPHVQRVQHQPY